MKKPKKSKSDFPETLYIYRSDDGEFYLCEEEIDPIAVIGKKIPVGIYTLTDAGTVNAMPFLTRNSDPGT